MSLSTTPKPRTSFSKLKQILEVPNLIDIQVKSFNWFLEEGLKETIQDISPIEDYTGKYAVEFGEYGFREPSLSIKECKDKDMTLAAPLFMEVSFICKETGEIRRQEVFMGDFPMMTEQGTFIINGTERVIVTQLVRSPGAYVMATKDPSKQVLVANLMPARGSWLEFEIDKRGMVNVRIDRKRKLPATTFLRAMAGIRNEETGDDPGFLAQGSDEEILSLFDGNPFIQNTLEKDTIKTVEEALVELFKKQRPGEPPTLDASRSLLRNICFDPKRYDLTRVGRHKLNTRLNLDIPEGVRTLRKLDIVALVRELVSLPVEIDHEGLLLDAKDLAEVAVHLPWDEQVHRLDEYENFGNRRLRTVGELVQEAFRIGLYRMERVVRERMTTEAVETITPQSIINIRPVMAAVKEFFGSSQLSQFMDQTNSLAGLTLRRRLSALGAGGLTRERAPIEVRDVHSTHYGRMCPIETPEGPNIGLIGSLASYAKVNDFGFIQTPYRKVIEGRVTNEIDWLTAYEEDKYTIAQATAEFDPETGELLEDAVLAISTGGEYVSAPKMEVHYMDVSPQQIVSVATALIPFLEHDDANRALMGSNMQRQAVPLLRSEAPLIGTGMENRAAVDTGDVVRAKRAGTVRGVSADRILIETATGEIDRYDLLKFERSNQGTLIHQKPVVDVGQDVDDGAVLADGASTSLGELALGRNLLVAFMSWEGYNFEDSIIISERLLKDDVLTSIHIEEHEIEARSTKLGDEEITRDIPNRSEESLADLDEDGIVRIGAEVSSGDLLVGKITPKGETELTAEEKLIRAIFKEKAREVRDTSLKVPHGEKGVVIDVKEFSRENGDDLSPGVNRLVRVYVAKKRKVAEGDKLAGRHGNKGVISKIVPEEDMPFMEDGTPVDIVLNPLGVPSRMNIGQVMETHLGWAAHHGFYKVERNELDMEADDEIRRKDMTWEEELALVRKYYRVVDESPAQGPSPVATPVFDGASLEEVDRALLGWAMAHPDSQVRMRLNLNRPDGTRVSGKVQLYDGRSGEPYEEKITVGYMYMLKLHHLVDDKIHARSTGPYSLVTQQPLGGKAQFGGQRFGEMEVWALEAYGAAYTLQEMLTIKSDDTVGRVKSYETIVKGENIARPGIPESFKVLIKEMQSLCLDVNVTSEEGGVLEVAEEEDDLLRAAEELGIDLAARRRAEERAAEAQAALVADKTALGFDDDEEESGEEAGVDGAFDEGEDLEDIVSELDGEPFDPDRAGLGVETVPGMHIAEDEE
ncbi:MAG: DNA-directed RNA polymerase subunit beta [Actinobacteria bacterium ADurb.Bin444]|nr:MAG: DNA-directed RNA polymerase subunit beta [Actinobacteria bacterium ADurb.Bin444]